MKGTLQSPWLHSQTPALVLPRRHDSCPNSSILPKTGRQLRCHLIFIVRASVLSGASSESILQQGKVKKKNPSEKCTSAKKAALVTNNNGRHLIFNLNASFLLAESEADSPQ